MGTTPLDATDHELTLGMPDESDPAVSHGTDQALVEDIIDKIVLVIDELSGHPLRPYQLPLARRILESLITEDSAKLTALWSRQSGKSETVADTVCGAAIMLPRLAKLFPDLLGKFREGLWIGVFAPTDEMSETLFSRIVGRLTSERAQDLMADPEIDEKIITRGKLLRFKRCGSLIRKQTAHPKAQIEGQTYHLVVIDEAQAADDKVLNKSIAPMLSSTAGTLCLTGTPSYTKNGFYEQIQKNKREANRKGRKNDHFQVDWKEVSKHVTRYKKFVQSEMDRLGEESDEFKLSYRLIWLLDKGMLVTSDRFDSLGDVSMRVVQEWHRSPVVVGIDPARKTDSTVVTICWINWDYPNEHGQFEHRVLNWLDLTGTDWETQYYRIVEFLSHYNVFAIGIDAGGLGDVVASRLRVLMPYAQIVDLKSDRTNQTKRWAHMMDLMSKGLVIWPAHAKTRQTKNWRKFRQQMEDAELTYQGPHIIVAAPEVDAAHDDYVDSLSNALYLTADIAMPEAEMHNSPW
ncbi:phage terminase large subunit family protein [Streptomyces sp. NBC_01451]|uniref:phage terminase large subunit family protein n=1 Tax=Streptomyces sp. NBC_01451 TaxID=2903872 RepID=UPI002E31DE87|nr:terminase family protein [Streptomyces sp. NBC_01451]